MVAASWGQLVFGAGIGLRWELGGGGGRVVVWGAVCDRCSPGEYVNLVRNFLPRDGQ